MSYQENDADKCSCRLGCLVICIVALLIDAAVFFLACGVFGCVSTLVIG